VGSASDHSLLLSLSLPSVESCLSYKTKLSTFLLWFLLLSSSLRPPTPKRRRTSLAGILPNSTTPPRFRWPRASSPPPLVPQLDPVQLRPSPSAESPHSEPPLTGAVRASPRRQQPPSSSSSTDPSMEIVSPSPTDAPAHVRWSCSPAFRWERRRAATTAAPPRRQQGSSSARRVPLRPTHSP
jgi:hypothetical protein